MSHRKPDSHKGDYGRVFIIAGSARFSGAAVLTAEACLRSGAGLVTLGIPKSLVNPLIKIKPREVMLLPLPETGGRSLSLKALKKIREFSRDADVIILGPGLDREKSTLALARKIIAGVRKKLIIDADGLRALSGHLRILRTKQDKRRTIVLTPHPGEMALLLGTSAKEVQHNREKLAIEFARRHGVVLVLKGHETVVADSLNDLYINKTGNPGMATAGSGDVLTGVIAAFLAQGLSAFEAAKYGVYLHGVSGDLAAGDKTQISLIASDIIAKIPEAVKRCS